MQGHFHLTELIFRDILSVTPYRLQTLCIIKGDVTTEEMPRQLIFVIVVVTLVHR